MQLFSDLIERWKTAGRNAVDTVADYTGIAYFREKLTRVADDDADAVTLSVPGYRQIHSYSCGWTAGLMVLHTFHPDSPPGELWQKVAPHEDRGTSTGKLAKGLRQSDIRVSVRQGLSFAELTKHIDAGRPVICTVKTKYDYTHWVVIYGFGKNPNRVYVAGNGLPHLNSNTYSWADFKRRRDPRADYLICSGK